MSDPELLEITMLDTVLSQLFVPPNIPGMKRCPPPDGDTHGLVLTLVPNDQDAETLYMRLDPPHTVYYRESLDHTAALRTPPAEPDSVVHVGTGHVNVAESPAAQVLNEVIEQFPFPESLRGFTRYAELPYQASLTIVSALLASRIEHMTGKHAPTLVLEGNALEVERTLLYLTLWLSNIFYLARQRMSAHDN